MYLLASSSLIIGLPLIKDTRVSSLDPLVFSTADCFARCSRQSPPWPCLSTKHSLGHEFLFLCLRLLLATKQQTEISEQQPGSRIKSPWLSVCTILYSVHQYRQSSGLASHCQWPPCQGCPPLSPGPCTSSPPTSSSSLRFSRSSSRPIQRRVHVHRLHGKPAMCLMTGTIQCRR